MRRLIENSNRAIASVEVRRYHDLDSRWLAVVTTRAGLCYYMVWAGGAPSEASVRKAWWSCRRHFQPYYSR